jgi:hypothetical protein
VVRFNALYGSHPIVHAQIWEDLQKKAENEEEAAMNHDSFLMCVHFLKCYPTYEQLSGPFGQKISSHTFTFGGFLDCKSILFAHQKLTRTQ